MNMLFKVLVLILTVVSIQLFSGHSAFSQVATEEEMKSLDTKDMKIKKAQVEYIKDLDLLVFEMEVEGQAGKTIPKARGELNGAPVLAYVFPTNLNPVDIGFGGREGVVAFVIAVHPDFDDTPLWDENNDGIYTNDKLPWHTHWALLGPDDRVKGGLSVIEFKKGDKSVILPPTNPGMAMYLDSPGFSIVFDGNKVKGLIPAQRVNHNKEFNFDAVTAYMEVNTSDENRPLLGVYEVYDVLSGNLSLPYKVK